MQNSNRIKSKLSVQSGLVWDGTIKTIQKNQPESSSIVREFVSVKEAKALTGISDWTWRGWADSGICASVKMGHRILIPTSEIQRLLSEGLRPACRKVSGQEGRGQ